jgi:hypothetical protein
MGDNLFINIALLEHLWKLISQNAAHRLLERCFSAEEREQGITSRNRLAGDRVVITQVSCKLNSFGCDGYSLETLNRTPMRPNAPNGPTRRMPRSRQAPVEHPDFSGARRKPGRTEVYAITLPDIATEVSVMHQAVGALKDIKVRADFEVYLKKFLASLDIVLPNAAADSYRVPARRFGYLMRMTKERYKDESLELGDAGVKVKRLINEHLISLGINPKVPPVELLAR